jgi:hypothetical protein
MDQHQKEQQNGKAEPYHLSMPDTIANERPTRNPLAAYMVKPKVRFETQEREEKVVLLLRRHFVTNLGWLFTTIFLLVIPLFWGYVPFFHLFPDRFQIVLIILWYLVAVAFFLEHFLSWYFNVQLITDERIVDVDFYSLLYKEVSDTKIENVQDVTFVMGGALRALLNYGTVYIQTAGERREFDFEDVPHPNRVAKIINELLLEEEKERIEGRVR